MQKTHFKIPALLLLVLAAILVFSPTAYAKKTTLKIDTFWGPEFHAIKNSVNPALEAIEKETNGEVIFKKFYAQSLAKAKEGYEAAGMGLADVYFFTGPNYETGSMHKGSLFSLPMALPLGEENVEAACTIMEKIYNKHVIDEIDKQVMVVGWGVLSEYRFMTIKKASLISEFKGLTLRSSGGYHDDMILAINASPEMMPPGDLYEALEKGILDGVFHTYAAEYGWGTYEPLNFATNVGLATFPYYTLMNKRKFNALSKKSQAILLKHFRQSGVATAQSYYENERQHFKDMGIEELVLDEKTKKEMYELVIVPVWKKWIAECEKRNIDWKAMIRSLEAAWKEQGLTPVMEWANLVN